jgi:hypothetical protein
MALGVVTDMTTWDDNLRMADIPVEGPPEWRYHDLWTLNELDLLQQRRDLGVQGRALVEWYHHAEDDETRDALVRELGPLYNRRQGIIRELARRYWDNVRMAIEAQDHPDDIDVQRWLARTRASEQRRQRENAAWAARWIRIWQQAAEERRIKEASEARQAAREAIRVARMREAREEEERAAEWHTRMRETIEAEEAAERAARMREEADERAARMMEEEAAQVERIRAAREAEDGEIRPEWTRNPAITFMATLGTLMEGRYQAPGELQEAPEVPNAPAADVEAAAPSSDLISGDSRTLRPVGRGAVQVSRGQMEVTRQLS